MDCPPAIRRPDSPRIVAQYYSGSGNDIREGHWSSLPCDEPAAAALCEWPDRGQAEEVRPLTRIRDSEQEQEQEREQQEQ